ncbi:IS5 family transposase [Rhizobacter sp. SG703]|nr:IS5 family transposase [Rhizobacter sp. SG703]
MSQRSFASAEYAMKKKQTRREKFLGEMERIVPWTLMAVIEPLYPTSGRVGRQLPTKSRNRSVARVGAGRDDAAEVQAAAQRQQLTRALFDEINAHLGEKGLLMRAGTIVDPTIVAAPGSTKNEDKAETPRCTRRRRATSGTSG